MRIFAKVYIVYILYYIYGSLACCKEAREQLVAEGLKLLVYEALSY